MVGAAPMGALTANTHPRAEGTPILLLKVLGWGAMCGLYFRGGSQRCNNVQLFPLPLSGETGHGVCLLVKMVSAPSQKKRVISLSFSIW